MNASGFEIVYGVNSPEVDHINFNNSKLTSWDDINDESQLYSWMDNIGLTHIGVHLGTKCVVLYSNKSDIEFNPSEAIEKWNKLMNDNIIVLKKGATPRFYAIRFFDK